jgi:methionyl-tRNA formyltransferase
MKSDKIGFIGSGDWGVVFLRDPSLFTDYVLDTVLVTSDTNKSHLEKISRNATICFYSSKESYSVFVEKGLDAIVMAGWPYKVPANFISSLSCPIVNIHASLLPKYRGPEPIIQQLLHDETEGGVTLHKIDQNFDTGPICVQVGFKIEQSDNNRTLFFKAVRAGRKALDSFLKKLRTEQLTFSPQDESQSTYYPRLNIMEFVINETMSKAEVLRITRAFLGQYPLVCNYQNQLLCLWEFKFFDALMDTNNAILVLKDGFLELIKYVPFDKPIFSTRTGCKKRNDRSCYEHY